MLVAQIRREDPGYVKYGPERCRDALNRLRKRLGIGA